MPWLRHHSRLAEGYRQRTLRSGLFPAELWIQSASVGESYLTWELFKQLSPSRPIRVLATANTRQGFEILEEAAQAVRFQNPMIRIRARYFPFDRPSLMGRALDAVRPRLAVFLETELWPGLLCALKIRRIPSLIVNGRISAKSLRGYRAWPSLWDRIGPDRILAVSETDAGRYQTLFPRAGVEVMDNVKFDRLAFDASSDDRSRIQLAEWIHPDHPFLVLGSIRREEESLVEKMILHVRSRHPGVVIGLFPRHLHRIRSWEKRLERHAVPFTLRSRVRSPLASGEVLLADGIGELTSAYHLADAVFVGGSLAPLGGQNFLEPLICGISPVIGPHWDNFKWIGTEIFDQGLVRTGGDWRAVSDFLLKDLTEDASRDALMKRAGRYLQSRRGGARRACRVMESFLNGKSP